MNNQQNIKKVRHFSQSSTMVKISLVGYLGGRVSIVLYY